MTITSNRKEAFRLAAVLSAIGAGMTVYLSYQADTALAAFAIGLMLLLIAVYFLLGHARFFMPRYT